jgi:2-succinyl-5-enolpyruvyl-6-hydroxy-3-cyclohexene-1-carboxylate synthase
MSGADEAAGAFVGAFVDELVRSGVRHVCIAPGSRSTPLAITLASHSGIRPWVHLDERAAAFFALGMARDLGEPVGLLCTSGTAAANFLPAVVEAAAAGVPLVVMTADRPPELRDVGAAQTIDQAGLYGVHARWFVDVALPEATPELLRYARTLACRAVARAAATPAGPVHLNFPFREPLVPVTAPEPDGMSAADVLSWRGRPGGAPWVRIADASPAASPETVADLAAALRASQRPVFVCGPQSDPALAGPLTVLARMAGAPVLADPLSQVRWSPSAREVVIDRYDAALRHDPAAARLAPDLIVRLGALPTSKPLLQYLQRHGGVRYVVVDPARWPEPSLLASHMIHAEPRALCDALVHALAAAPGSADAAWLARWRDVDARAARALEAHGASVDEPFEGRVLADVASLVPDGGTLVVSSSMPVRDLDAFAAGDARALRVIANRGANGIDGVVSTALGAAAAARERGGGPVVLVIGDLAFHHDLTGLVAAKLHDIDCTIVVINNDGGGIFSFLPQAADREHFEQLFGTPHGLTFGAAAALYGARHSRADTVEALRSDVAVGTRGSGVHIIEVHTARDRNVALHREAWAAVAAALDAG